MIHGTWRDLARELDEWAASGQRATLWWRDDDAVAHTSALDRLFDTAGSIPIALAVIPAKLEDSLAARPPRWVLQHGYSHQNHAPDHASKMELGPHRPFPHTLADLATGRARLEAAFGAAARPVLVPPWNRIAPGLVPLLPEIGFTGLSTLGRRTRAQAVRGCAQANVHVDIIDWRGSRGFAGEDTCLGTLVAHLAARRQGSAQADEPSGVMTHHLVHDGMCWAFLERLVAETANHPGARWLDAGAVFAVTP